MRTRVMRVVRELVTTRALASSDRFQLHAAALAHQGRALLLAGPKGAGKTTLLGSLTATGAAILANDRVLLRADASPAADVPASFVVHGVPTIVSIRPGTLALLPRLARGVVAGERLVHLTLAEADVARPRRGNAAPSAALALSPAQLARQLDTRLGAPAPLGAVVFPEPHSDPDGLAVERLDAEDAERRLLTARYGRHTGTSEATVFDLTRVRRTDAADHAAIAALAGRIPCFVVRTGTRRLADRRTAAAILARVQ
jgi:energy-coupling factor transporter ATP-binding protein EcfA2